MEVYDSLLQSLAIVPTLRSDFLIVIILELKTMKREQLKLF